MASTAPDRTGSDQDPRRRRGLVWTLIVLAAVIALVSSMTIWVKRQALNTDSWVDASSALLQNDEIRHALSVYVVDELYSSGDVSARLQESLPPNLAGLAGPLSGALREPAVTAVDGLLQRPRVEAIWAEVNRVAHEQLLALLEGQPRPNISTANGDVVLDLRSFIVDVGTQLGIGDQLDQRLPPDVGQVTVLQSDGLATAQDVVKAIKALSILLGIITFALWALALWLAQGWRRVALRGIGISLVIVGVLLLVVRRMAGSYVVDQLTSGGDIRDAANSTWLIGTTLLAELGWAFLIYGVVVVVGAWLAGPSASAAKVRNWCAPLLVDRPGLAWTVVGILFLLVVWWGPTPAFRRPLGLLVLAVLLAAGFELLRRITAAQQEASAEPSAESPAEPGTDSMAADSAPVPAQAPEETPADKT